MTKAKSTLSISPDQAREVLMSWLQPYTENGSMDELFDTFIRELSPYAAQVANRILQRRFPPQPGDEKVVSRLRISLGQILSVIDRVNDNPAMMIAADFDTGRDLLEAQRKLRDWMVFLETWPAYSPESAVPAAHEAILAAGGLP